MKRKLPRRDMCYALSRRALKLSQPQAATAWLLLASSIHRLSDRDLPKFADLFDAVRRATINARRETPEHS